MRKRIPGVPSQTVGPYLHIGLTPARFGVREIFSPVVADAGMPGTHIRIEGRVFDLTHAVNVLRKERGLEVSDRIRLELPAADSDLLERYRERIAEETLAVEIEVGGSLDLRKA